MTVRFGFFEIWLVTPRVQPAPTSRHAHATNRQLALSSGGHRSGGVCTHTWPRACSSARERAMRALELSAAPPRGRAVGLAAPSASPPRKARAIADPSSPPPRARAPVLARKRVALGGFGAGVVVVVVAAAEQQALEGACSVAHGPRARCRRRTRPCRAARPRARRRRERATRRRARRSRAARARLAPGARARVAAPRCSLSPRTARRAATHGTARHADASSFEVRAACANPHDERARGREYPRGVP